MRNIFESNQFIKDEDHDQVITDYQSAGKFNQTHGSTIHDSAGSLNETKMRINPNINV